MGNQGYSLAQRNGATIRSFGPISVPLAQAGREGFFRAADGLLERATP
jgi:hypothetical protein